MFKRIYKGYISPSPCFQNKFQSFQQFTLPSCQNGTTIGVTCASAISRPTPDRINSHYWSKRFRKES